MDYSVVYSRHDRRACDFWRLAPRTLPYKFDVGANTFAATSFSFSIDPLGPSQGQVTSDNPIGSVLTIHYNRMHPGIAAVSPGLNSHFLINILLGVILLAVGAKIVSKLAPKV